MREQNSVAKWIVISVVAVAVITLLFGSFYYIQPGHRGVLVTLGKVSDRSYSNGVGLKWPYISSMEKMDVRTIAVNSSTSTYTSDVQEAKIDYTFTYSLAPENVNILYESVGTDYYSKKIAPVLFGVLKDVVGKWQAQELINHREEAASQIVVKLREQLDPTFFRDATFSFIDIDYSDQFEKAIEAKVIAEQDAQKAKNNTIRIEEEAKQKLISAKAEAEAMRVKSEALARNQKLVEYEAVLKWDGKLPQYMFSGNGSVPMIQIPGAK